MEGEWQHKSLQDELDEEMRKLIDKKLWEALINPVIEEYPDGTVHAKWYYPYILSSDYIDVEGKVIERKELPDGKD